jgi:hypothetical protein
MLCTLSGNVFDVDPNLWRDDEKVTFMENEELTKPFLEEEIKMALFQMERNKAVGSDGIPIESFTNIVGRLSRWTRSHCSMNFIMGTWMSRESIMELLPCSLR